MRELVDHIEGINRLMALYGVKFGIYKNGKIPYTPAWSAPMTTRRMRNAATSSSAANTWNDWICTCGWIIRTA